MNYIPKPRMVRFLIILSISAIALSCKINKSNPEQPNIVWITSEDNSKHYLKLFDENGIPTPNIESLAAHGVVFNRAFSNGAVCSVARSAIISGCYGPRIGTQYHRKLQAVPMPDAIKMFPAYLREAGYYTTNNHKEDYNLIKGEGVWDASSRKATWRKRAEGQAFFHVHNIGVSHESSLHFTREEMHVNPTNTKENSFTLQPNHPNTKVFKYTNAYYRDKIQEMDQQVGKVIKALKEEGLLHNTFIFYFGDHGGVLPGSKGYLYETGLHVPLVVHIPEKYKHLVDLQIGSTVSGFVSFIDLAPTLLHLAGIKIPKGMDGKPFLGNGISIEALNARDETFSYADRFDEKYDHVRAIRKGKFKYIRNYQPFNYDGLMNNYRYKQLAYKEWQSMFEKGALNETQSAFFQHREPEMLFDIDSDPFETHNLINDPKYLDTANDMRMRLRKWIKEMPDLSFFPEHHLIENAFDHPVTFGKIHQQEIWKYVDIADLCLSEFKSVKQSLIESLTAPDPWERYWGLIACSSFRELAISLEPQIKHIALHDPETINRVRAAEFMGITDLQDPSDIMTSSLYNAKNAGEALLILNAIVLMQSHPYNYDFTITSHKIPEAITAHPEVKNRLQYLNIL